MSQSTRHERVTQLFLAASALAPEARGDFLDVECGDDLALRGEVEAMLVHDEHPPALLETPALGPEFKIMWQAPAEGPDAEDGIVGETAVMASSATSERPTQLGRYRITDTIAEGGVGIVYLAEQESPSRRVALKVLGPGSLSRRMLHRFEHEADILGRLRHPGIAQIFEAGVANAGFGPQPFFAMEYVAGCSLTEYVTVHKLSLRTRLELLVDICDAVHHAHQKGVVHRDLKPANIIVDESGRPKILDFGVARVTDADLHATTMHTERGQLLGTVPYMSPEQAAGDVRDIDVRSDVYALGVVAYEMLSGRLPYDVHELMLHDAVRTIQEVEPVPLGTVDRSLRGDVETIVAKALAKPRERRYQSASDLAADIKRFLVHEPIAARPASSAYRLQRFARRHRSMVTGVGIAILAVLAGLTTTTWQAITADRERNRAIVAERDAQQRFDQVRALANTFIFDVHDEIEQVPGTTAARRMMVETAIRYLDALAVEPIDDPTLRDEIADGYMKVGDVLGNPHRANLGDKDGALESYERALAIRRRLLDRAPESDDARLDVAESLRATASILTVTGKTAAAWERHEQAIGLAQDVLAVDPDHQRALREVATNKGLMGRLASKRGETELAAELLRHAVTTGQTLYDASPDDPTRIFALRGSLNQLAAVQQWAGQTAEALANYHRAHDLAERLCAIDPDNTRYRRALFTSRLGLGDVLSNSGRTDEALVEFEGALLAVRAAAASDPNDRRAQQDIGFACERIAYIHLRRGRHEAALAHFEEGRAARAAVVAASPEDTEASYNLAISTIQVGEAAAAVGRTEDALALFEDALARTEALYAVDPADFWYQDLIAVALQNVAETRVALGQLDEAQATYARMHEVATGLVDIDPDTAQNRGLLAHSLMGLGTVYEKQERYDDALVSYREGLRIREAIADQDAANAAARLEVGQSHEHLGDLLGFTMAEPVEGVAHYRAAIEIRESVAPAGPGARGRTAALAYDYSQLALVLSAVGEVNEGIEALSSCVELLEMVVQSEPTEAARRDLAEALERLAAAQATRARDAGAPTGDRVAGLEAACGHYEHALELLDDPALDASRRIREALAACRRALADLGNPVRQGGS